MIRDVIETSFDSVSAFLDGVIGTTESLPDEPEGELFKSWSKQINDRTMVEAGLSYTTYLRLKISGVIDRYAETVCDVCNYPADSNHAQLVRGVLRQWADDAGLFSQGANPTEAQLALLRELDLDYGQRRLRFVIAALRWWYRDLEKGKPNIPSRAELDRGKQILYDAVEKLRATMGGDEFAEALRDADQGLPSREHGDLVPRLERPRPGRVPEASTGSGSTRPRRSCGRSSAAGSRGSAATSTAS